MRAKEEQLRSSEGDGAADGDAAAKSEPRAAEREQVEGLHNERPKGRTLWAKRSSGRITAASPSTKSILIIYH